MPRLSINLIANLYTTYLSILVLEIRVNTIKIYTT